MKPILRNIENETGRMQSATEEKLKIESMRGEKLIRMQSKNINESIIRLTVKDY